MRRLIRILQRPRQLRIPGRLTNGSCIGDSDNDAGCAPATIGPNGPKPVVNTVTVATMVSTIACVLLPINW